MFMRFHDTSNLASCMFLCIVLLSSSSLLAAPRQKTGTLVGSMGLVDKAEKVSLGSASNVTVELEHKHQVILLLSDDHGYYVKELPEGTYCLKAARDAKGNPLHFSPRQHHC